MAGWVAQGGWPPGWLAGRLAGWADWLDVWLAGWLAGWLPGRAWPGLAAPVLRISLRISWFSLYFGIQNRKFFRRASRAGIVYFLKDFMVSSVSYNPKL